MFMVSLPSVAVTLGIVSLPACKMTQPARVESNWDVKNRGSGVGEGSSVGVGSGVLVAGIGVGRCVSVRRGVGSDVGVVVWQAVMRMRHPIRMIFFIP